MNRPLASFDRRRFLGGSLALGFGAATFSAAHGAFAEELARTPRLTEGPFYPDKLPLDTDNDLLIINDSITPAVGDITHLTGRVLSRAASRSRTRSSKSGSATTRASTSHRATAAGRNDTELPGVRPLHHRLEGRVLLPHHQAGAVHRPHAAHPRQGQEGRQGTAHHPALRQRPSAEQDGRGLPRPPRPARPGTRPRRFQAAQGLEDRRIVGPLRHRGRSSRPRNRAPTSGR